jgi:hypothetical protein
MRTLIFPKILVTVYASTIVVWERYAPAKPSRSKAVASGRWLPRCQAVRRRKVRAAGDPRGREAAFERNAAFLSRSRGRPSDAVRTIRSDRFRGKRCTTRFAAMSRGRRCRSHRLPALLHHRSQPSIIIATFSRLKFPPPDPLTVLPCFSLTAT